MMKPVPAGTNPPPPLQCVTSCRPPHPCSFCVLDRGPKANPSEKSEIVSPRVHNEPSTSSKKIFEATAALQGRVHANGCLLWRARSAKVHSPLLANIEAAAAHPKNIGDSLFLVDEHGAVYRPAQDQFKRWRDTRLPIVCERFAPPQTLHK